MGARSRCFAVPFVALLLAAASVRAQDSGPIEQPPGESLPAGEPCIPSPLRPFVLFPSRLAVDVARRAVERHPQLHRRARRRQFRQPAQPLPAITATASRADVRLGNWIFEGVYSHFGDWDASLNENVNGVAFNASALAGNWAGPTYNSINANTYFTPIVNAASLTSPVNTAGDQSGLGPECRFFHRSQAGPHGPFA